MTLQNPYLNKMAVFIAVFTLALILRLIFVFQWDATPYGVHPVLDAMVYDNWGQAIAGGEIFRAKAFYASPLFPYILGLIYAVFGHELLLVGLFNALLGAATVLALSALTLTLFGIEAALAAGLLAAFYMPFIFYTAPVMKEPLALLLLTLFLIYALRALKQNRMRDYAVGGAMLGLCTLVRGNILLLAPALLLFAFTKERSASVKNGAVFVGMICLCIAPATLHNYIVSDDFVPINYAYGFNLYIGNSPTANGTNNYPPEISTDPVQEEFATVWEARQALRHDPKPSEVSDFWRNRALDYIWHNPMQEFFLLKNKIVAFWNATEAFDNYEIGFIRKNFDTILSWPLIPFWLVAFLAAFGAVAAWRAHRENVTVLAVFGFTYTASVLMFYVTDRYRLPIVIFLLPLAGAALPYGWKRTREKDWRPVGIGAALAVLTVLICFLPFPGAVDLTAFDWGTLSTIYADENDNDKALDALHKALSISSTDVGAQTFVSAAFIEHGRGNDAETEHLFQMAMKAYPNNGVIRYSYGRFKAMNGDIKGALEAMTEAVRLAPSFALNYYGLAMIYDRLGEHAKALEAAQQGLTIDPSDALLQGISQKLGEKGPP